MVLNTTTSNAIRLLALNEFDDVDHIGFSDDTNDELASSDDLTDEFIRQAVTTNTKDTGAYTNEFETVLGLTEGNGNTIAKIGLFTDESGSTLQVSKVLPVAIAKTADYEITVAYEIATTVEDNT